MNEFVKYSRDQLQDYPTSSVFFSLVHFCNIAGSSRPSWSCWSDWGLCDMSFASCNALHDGFPKNVCHQRCCTGVGWWGGRRMWSWGTVAMLAGLFAAGCFWTGLARRWTRLPPFSSMLICWNLQLLDWFVLFPRLLDPCVCLCQGSLGQRLWQMGSALRLALGAQLVLSHRFHQAELWDEATHGWDKPANVTANSSEWSTSMTPNHHMCQHTPQLST